MKLAFYKGVHGNIFDWLILLWTWGKYSHVELVFGDNTSFSSSQWDSGVRFKKINYSHLNRWDFIELPFDADEEEVIKEKCKKLVGKAYDWIGIIFDQFLPLNIHDQDKWWCSEVVANVLGILPERVSPNKLHRMLIGKPQST